MREIKFRVWVEWLDPPKMEYCGMERSGMMYDTGNKVMQFTGLKDKNGKEIWESDIVMFNGGLKVIEWVDAGFNLVSGKECNVVGNIFQDEELVP